MPAFSKWTVTATYALWFGEVHASVAKWSASSCSYFYWRCIYNQSFGRNSNILTCSIFAICFQTWMKTPLTSWETVAGEGIWYSSHPVFIRLQKPWLFTILKGHLLWKTQCTISALHSQCMRLEMCLDKGVLLTWILLKYADNANRIPSLSQCSNSAIIEPSRSFVFNRTTWALSKSWVPSATATASLPQQFLACWQRPLVDSVQKPTNIPPIFSSTLPSTTFKHIHTMVIHILNPRWQFEENINRWIPILQ